MRTIPFAVITAVAALVLASCGPSEEQIAAKARHDSLMIHSPEYADSVNRAEAERAAAAKAEARERKMRGRESEAEVIAERAVAEKLRNPSSADFDSMQRKSTYTGNGAYTVTGSLTAENDFGAEKSYVYIAEVVYDPDAEQWTAPAVDVSLSR